MLLGRSVARGAERALTAQTIILASAAVVMATMTASTALAGPVAAKSSGSAASPASRGLIGGVALGFTIIIANRPAFLFPVPPGRAGDPAAEEKANSSMMRPCHFSMGRFCR